MGFVTDLFGADKAKEAARRQAEGYEQAADTARLYGAQAQGRFEPYAQTGQQANRLIQAALAGDYSGFYESPDYQFRLEEGQRALDRGAASRGMLLSGAQLRDTQRFGQGLASTEYGNWWNRLAGQQGLGAGIAGQRAGIDVGIGDRVGAAQTGAAGARASGYLADANVQNSLAGGLLDLGTTYLTGGF